MTNSVFILGRQPELGLAELESIFPDIKPLNSRSAVLNQTVEPSIIDKLGGSIKIATEIISNSSGDWSIVENFVNSFEVSSLPSTRKINFGISCYGLDAAPEVLNRLMLGLKKRAKKSGISFRVIPNKSGDLSTAQVLHNKLAGESGFELLVIKTGSGLTFAKTIAVQDIESYSNRDQARPNRDARVGMLPPKLAQIMINLSRPNSDSIILDPFCGTGVILQESLLMGYECVGSDIDPRMVRFSEENLKWLKTRYSSLPKWEVYEADATKEKWSYQSLCIACETFLGKLFLKQPSASEIDKELNETNQLIKSFLKNLASQLKPGTTMCIAIPAWSTNQGFVKLPLLDHIGEIGYNFMSFKTVNGTDLLYYRPQQSVARQLLALVRN